MTGSDDYEGRLRRVFKARDASDIAYLIGALRDPDVRQVAAKWLGEAGAAEAVDALTLLLSANEASARTAAVRALGKLGVGSALPRLVAVAEKDESWIVRDWAISALGEFNGTEVTTVLTRLLGDPDPRLRRTVATVLGRRGDPDALDALRAASRAQPWMQRRVYSRAIRAIERS